MKNNIGVWIDSDKAVIINNAEDGLKTIMSDIEHSHIGGGARAKTPYGTQDASSEKKLLERKKHQTKLYFDEILEHLNKANKIVVFGPAETKIALQKELIKNGSFKEKLAGVETVDNRLSEKQLKEWVRNFYGK